MRQTLRLSQKRPIKITMKRYKFVFLFTLAISILPVIYQNCASYSDNGLNANQSSMTVLSMSFDSSAINNIPLTQTSLLINGQCNVGTYPSHIFYWKLEVLGSPTVPTGTAPQACVGGRFSLNIPLTGATLTSGAKGLFSAYIVGIDNSNQQHIGPNTNSLVLDFTPAF